MKPSLFIPLEAVRVASPCSADWNAMTGDDRTRFCAGCAKNVYDLSALTRAQAEALIAEKEGHLCVRYFQRADGTILTADCPVGLLRLRQNTPPRVLPWVQMSALTLLIGALVVGAVSPQILHAQPPEPLPTAPAPVPTLTAEPTATPLPTIAPSHSPPPTATLGEPLPLPRPTATPAPEMSALMGEVAIMVPAATPAPPPTTLTRHMGRFAVATPAPTPPSGDQTGATAQTSAPLVCQATPNPEAASTGVMGQMALVPVATSVAKPAK